MFDFRFDLPAQCADALGSGDADIGIVPCAELDRLGLDYLPDVGIACEGEVRTILLISRRPIREIRTVSLDSGSRTSVALTRILLAERYGVRPEVRSQKPVLEEMLAVSDAALIIGDPALGLEPAALPFETLDLGAEWVDWTGLPMVFAVWAGRKAVLTPEVAEAFRASREWGRTHLDEMVTRAAEERGFREDLVRRYFTRHIRYELGPLHLEGLETFRELVRRLEPIRIAV
jgi:chorismate dehydratase